MSFDTLHYTIPVLQVFKIFSTVWARILVFLRPLVLRVQASMGISNQTADIRSSAQYSST